jgi:alpha-D-xyloside xylohydrolase
MRPAPRTPLVALVLLGVACGDAGTAGQADSTGTGTSTGDTGTGEATTPTTGDTSSGTGTSSGTDTDGPEDTTVTVTWEGLELVLRRGDEVLLRFPADGRASTGSASTFDTPEHRGPDPGHAARDRRRARELLQRGARAGAARAVGTRGWGLFVESVYPASSTWRAGDDRVEAAFGTGRRLARGPRFHLFAAAHPLDVTRHYYATTGGGAAAGAVGARPVDLARRERGPGPGARRRARRLRELDLATTAIWIDSPYASAVNTFDWTRPFPDPSAMIAHHARRRPPHRALARALPRRGTAHGRLLAEAETGLLSRPTSACPQRLGRAPSTSPTPTPSRGGRAADRRTRDARHRGLQARLRRGRVTGPTGARTPGCSPTAATSAPCTRAFSARVPRHVRRDPAARTGGFLLCRAARYGDQAERQRDLARRSRRHLRPPRRERGEPTARAYVAVGGLPASAGRRAVARPLGLPLLRLRHRRLPPLAPRQRADHPLVRADRAVDRDAGRHQHQRRPLGVHPGHRLRRRDARLVPRLCALHLRLFPYVWTYAQRLAVDGRPMQRPLGLACTPSSASTRTTSTCSATTCWSRPWSTRRHVAHADAAAGELGGLVDRRSPA